MWICAQHSCAIIAGILVCLFCAVENRAIDHVASRHIGLAGVKAPAKMILLMAAILLYWALTDGLLYVSMLSGIDPKGLNFTQFVRAWLPLLPR